MAKKVASKISNALGANSISINNPCNYVISLLGQGGFGGIESIQQLMLNGCKNIPNKKGIFMVLTTDIEYPGFCTEEQIKNKYQVANLKKPLSAILEEAQNRWIENNYILFIGGTTSTGLKERIKNFIKFGKGETDDRCGGWYVWLLRCLCPILLCWVSLPDVCNPINVRDSLIREFKKYHNGNQPYANVQNV